MYPITKENYYSPAALFYDTRPLTHAERRRQRELNLIRRVQRLTLAETLERATLRFRMIGMEVN